MTRTHPPTLIKLAERVLQDECRLERGERILAAVSGGGDSTALLHVLSILSRRLGFELVAHGVDHGLRAEASAELDGAAALAESLGVPFARTRVDVTPGGNLQARARDARRSALLDAAHVARATRVATAHHADDRAETVLIRLLHGATARGLAVLPPVDGVFIRPFIRARKEDVLRHLQRHGVPFAEDPSNRNRRFLRVRVRLEVLPLLEELSPAIVTHLTALADDIGHAVAGGWGAVDLIDATGKAVSLKRAQTIALRRAVRLGQTVEILLSGNRKYVADPKAYEVRVDATPRAPQKHLNEDRRRNRPRLRGQKGGAKSGKSG